MKNPVILSLTILSSLALAGQDAMAVEVTSKAEEIKLTGRVQAQFNTSSVEGQIGSEFLIRRARFTAEVKLNDFVSGKVQPDFGGGGVSLKDAYIELTYSSNAIFRIGQFKRPFDQFELTSSTEILVVERAGGIRGSSVVSLSSLTEGLGYSDRDIGAEVLLQDSNKRFSLTAAVTNGVGSNHIPSKTPGAIGEKQYIARGKILPLAGRNLSFAVGGTMRPHTIPDEDTTKATAELDVEYSPAVQLDVEYGDFKGGPHVQAGGIWGENWKEDAADPPAFVAAQAIGTYKIPVKNDYIEAVEPVVRVGYADPNTDVANDGGILVTPGVQFFFVGRNKIVFNVDVFLPEAENADTDYAVRVQSSVHF